MKSGASDLKNTQQKNDTRESPRGSGGLPRYMANRRGGGAAQYAARFSARSRGPVPPPPPPQQTATSESAAAAGAFDDDVIPLSMSDDAPFVAANAKVETNTMEDDRSRYFQKLRITSHGAKRTEEATGKHSQPVTIQNAGRKHKHKRSGRKTSAPQPTTAKLRAEGNARAKGKGKGKDSSAAAAASTTAPKPRTDSGAIELDLDLLFGEGEESPNVHSRYRSHSAADADSFEEDDDSVDSPYRRTTKQFTFIPPHRLTRRRARGEATDSLEEELVYTGSDTSSQL